MLPVMALPCGYGGCQGSSPRAHNSRLWCWNITRSSRGGFILSARSGWLARVYEPLPADSALSVWLSSLCSSQPPTPPSRRFQLPASGQRNQNSTQSSCAASAIQTSGARGCQRWPEPFCMQTANIFLVRIFLWPHFLFLVLSSPRGHSSPDRVLLHDKNL